VLRCRLAAVDGLLAPLGSGQLAHTPPPHVQPPWPHANNAQRQLLQASLCLLLCSAARYAQPSVFRAHAQHARAHARHELDLGNLLLLMCYHAAAAAAAAFILQVQCDQAPAPAVTCRTAHHGHTILHPALQQDLPAAMALQHEGRTSRGPAAAAPLGRTSDTSLRLKTEPLPHGAEPGAVPSSAATMLAVSLSDPHFSRILCILRFHAKHMPQSCTGLIIQSQQGRDVTRMLCHHIMQTGWLS
jgi:hypothetical protein